MAWTRTARILCMMCVLASCGCGGQQPAERGEAEPLEEWFKRTQKNTVTTRGSVLTETARQDGDAVTFDNSDGTTLRQEYRSKGPEGYERNGDPEIVAPR